MAKRTSIMSLNSNCGLVCWTVLLSAILSSCVIECTTQPINCTLCWDKDWIDTFKKNDDTWVLVSRRQNITCFGGRVLFPYGPECADIELSKDLTRSERIKLGYKLKFMGHKFEEAWVNQHGFISFQESFLGQTLSHADWPQPMYPYVDDPVFIAPFYAQTDLVGDKIEDRIDTAHGRVLYKVIHRTSLPQYYTEEEKFVYQLSMKLLDESQNIIRDYLPSGEEFYAMYAFVATWKSVAFLGNSLIDIDLRPRNTFQTIIVSDDYTTFAIFNYENIEWYASTNLGGNPETGTGGRAAKIGFNRGNGTLWHGHRPFSENAQLMQKISNYSNVETPGRFVFRIDEWIQPAGNLDVDFQTEKKLEIWPRNANMLGGEEINITGPYFGDRETFLCKWGDGHDAVISIGETVYLNNEFLNRSTIKGRCIQPTIFYNGRLNLSISLDDGETFEWKAEYNIVDPMRWDSEIELVNVEQWYDSSTSGRLLIKWDRILFSYFESDLVDIELWGYYEDDTGPHWDLIQILGEQKLNKGSFGFDVAPNRAPNETMARKYKLGAIAVSLFDSEFEEADYKYAIRYYSALHPMGWWRNDEMKIYYDKHSFLFGNSRGRSWAEDQCRWWHEYRRFEDRAWMDELEICPPTVFFAIGDAGRWAPDPECNMYGDEYNDLNCLQHKEASHCVITLKRTESGAGNRCCYDEEGNLMYTNDTNSGSTPDRYHSLGIPPYNEYGKVPALSHYYHDVVPFYLCCQWSNLCESYLYLRQTKDAKGYKEPRIAVAYGDPHIITFDGKDYTFNGKGEFTLFKSKKYNFKLQARFEQPPNATFCLQSSKGQINATRITAIAAGQDDSDVVEVRARITPTQTIDFKCDILINGKIYYFNFTEEKIQFFKNVFVISPLTDMFQSNITIMFNSSGIGVNVECIDGLMHVRASAPPSLFKDTYGLFGYWDNVTANDFTSPDGSSNQLTLKPDLLYQRFGMAWRLKDESESIFTYSGGWSFDTFHDQRPMIREWQRFRPWFTHTEIPFPSNVTFTKDEWEETCDGDEQCLYDAAALGSLEVGEKTRDAHRYYRLLHENMKSVNSCGIYLVRGGVRTLSKGNYLVGSVMKISCKSGYTLFGYNEFYCNWNGTWLPTNGQWIDRFRDWPYCEHYHITAIRWVSVGISIAWVLCLAIGFIYTFFIKNKKQYIIDDDDDQQKEEPANFPFNDPTDDDEFKPLENNYYKDGFVPPVKLISNMTKSTTTLNAGDYSFSDDNENETEHENDNDSTLRKINSSNLENVDRIERPSIIFQLPMPNANESVTSESRQANPMTRRPIQNTNGSMYANSPEQFVNYSQVDPNRTLNRNVSANGNRSPNIDYQNQPNFNNYQQQPAVSMPIYQNQPNVYNDQYETNYRQPSQGILKKSNSSTASSNGPAPRVDTSNRPNQLDDANSPDNLKQQQQLMNPYLAKMQRLKEQQQRLLETQLRQQNNNNNFLVDSDV